MGPLNPLFDTNILIDFLCGREAAREELGRYRRKAVSAVTWMEVMVGSTPEVEGDTRTFLNGFVVLPLDAPVMEEAVVLRRQHRIKLPDAVIWASARRHGLTLVTRNSRDFPAGQPGIRVPYAL
jgi:Predicted nucleic acid-binding protein, contains PIN domain